MSDEAERGRLKAAEWLRSLLLRGERTEADQVKRTVTATPRELAAYKQSLEPAFRRAIHESLSTQRLAPAIEIVWARGQEGHELRTVRLRDLSQLRAYLGAAASTDVAAEAKRLAIESATRGYGLDPQLAGIIDRMHHEWVRNQPAYRLTPKTPAQIEIVLRTVAAIMAGEHKGLDMRSFSVRVHGSTKAVEAHHGIIERILSELYEGEGEAAAFNLEQYIGLEKTPQPFCLGGRLEFVQSDQATSQSTHYIGVPRTKVIGGRIATPVEGFLIVENWTTFEKAAAVAPERWVALFCAGFPAPGWVDAAVGLVRQFPTTELRHWGDLDIGGFRIFEHLARLLPRPLQPLMMDPEAYAGAGKPRPATEVEAKELGRISQRLPALAESIQKILDTGIFCLEQEAILPPSRWGLPNPHGEAGPHAGADLQISLHRG